MVSAKLYHLVRLGSNNQPQRSGVKKATTIVQHIGPDAPPVSLAPSVHVEVPEPNAFETKQMNKFAGKLLNDILVVEICAGSARLTRIAREAGFHGLAIDHSSSRSCGVDICLFELEDQTQVE